MERKKKHNNKSSWGGVIVPFDGSLVARKVDNDEGMCVLIRERERVKTRIHATTIIINWSDDDVQGLSQNRNRPLKYQDQKKKQFFEKFFDNNNK